MTDQYRLFLCFSIDANEQEARQAFIDKFGVPPLRIFSRYGMLWAGPVPEPLMNRSYSARESLRRAHLNPPSPLPQAESAEVDKE